MRISDWSSDVCSSDLHVEAAAAERADNARGDGLAEAERVADGNHEVSDLQPVGIAERDVREHLRFDLQQGDVGCGVAADEPRFEPAPVLQRYEDLVSPVAPRMVGGHIKSEAERGGKGG